MSSNNRRRHPRARVRNMVAHASAEGGRAVWIVDNLSVGGMFARTEKPLPVGSRVSVQIARPGLKRALSLTGRVVLVLEAKAAAARKAMPGMGIEWEELAEEDRRRLEEMLAQLGGTEELVARGRAVPSAPAAQAPSPPPSIKRRAQRRVPAKGTFAHLKTSGDVVGLGMPMANLSLGGVFVVSEGPLPVGTPVELELVHPEAPAHVVIQGEVAGVVSPQRGKDSNLRPGMSIRFGALSDQGSRALRRLMVRLAPVLGAELGVQEDAAPTPSAALPPNDEMDAFRSEAFDRRAIPLDGGPATEGSRGEEIRAELTRLRTEVDQRKRQIDALEAELRALEAADFEH